MANTVSPFLRSKSYSMATQISDPPYMFKFTLAAMCPRCQKECIIGSIIDDGGVVVKCESCGFKEIHKGYTAESVAKEVLHQLSEGNK